MNVPRLRHPEKAKRADMPIPRKPKWIRKKKIESAEYYDTRRLMREHELVTVCEEAACPNIGECWSKRHATMMIMGEICTRGCSFCNVATGRPDTLDAFEPVRVAQAVKKLGLRHVVITSVDRDDLKDGGAEHIAQTIRAVRHQNPNTTVEVLTPDTVDERIEVIKRRDDYDKHPEEYAAIWDKENRKLRNKIQKAKLIKDRCNLYRDFEKI